MATNLEITAVPTADTPGTCIYVHNDRHNYVFGRLSEGTQRAFNNRKTPMGGTEHIFLSGSVGWDQLGGLFGFLLTVAGSALAAKESMTAENLSRKKKGLKPLQQTWNGRIGVHGGDNLCHSLAACRPVILRQPVNVQPFEQRSDPRADDPNILEPDWQDEAIRVWKIPVRRARSSSPKKRRHDSPKPPGIDGDAAADDVLKSRGGPSDPSLAALMVEKVMFNGSLKGNGDLITKKLSLVKPTDTAFVKENNALKLYHGPYATDGNVLENPDDIVWVLPGPSDNINNSDEKIALNHYPLPRTVYSETSMSYIVKCHDRRGKFNAPAAKALGVEPFNFKLLTQGQSVQGKDGNTVTPDMVLGEPQPGKGFIVADLTGRDFLQSFLDRPEWTNAEMMSNVAAMYWILGPNMASDPQIQTFVKEHPQIKHVFCANETCPNMISLAGPAELQTKLRRIDPERFTLLKFDNAVHGTAPVGPNVELGRAGKRLKLMPHLLFDDGAVTPFPNLVEASNSVEEEVLELARQAKAESTDPAFLARLEEEEKDIPSRDAEIIPLGTGSSIPGKYRNVSATLIRVPGIGNYLLDCGEGTLGQMRRLFGDEEMAEILSDLRCIVISHLHADHHLGTVTIIKAWYEQTIANGGARLAISCISRYRKLLEELSQVEDIGFHRLQFVSCSLAKDKNLTTRQDLGDDNFGLNSIKRIPVPHCWRSYATEIELTSGLRIAYSGDCRPSENFARECEGTHLLIHECTFDNDMASHAQHKMHSTIDEALGVARQMRARRTLLTHFSQRYVKADSLKRQSSPGGDQVVLMAFDQMRVKLGDFRQAACYLPAVQKLMDKGNDGAAEP